MAGKTKIGRFLHSKGITQAQAAAYLGITETAFSNKAQGVTQFKQGEIAMLAKLCRMADAEIREVFLEG